MNPRTVLKTVAILAFAAFLYTMVTAQEAPSPLLGKPAPTLALSLSGGGTMNLASHAGKEIVVLDFWATWCPPCRKLLPEMLGIAREYKDKGVVVYPVNVGEDASTIMNFQKEAGLTFDAVLDARGEASNAYGVEFIPTSVIIDKNGVVQAYHSGVPFGFADKLRKELDSLLEGKSLVKPAERHTEEKVQGKK